MRRILSLYFLFSVVIIAQAQTPVLYGTTSAGGNEGNGTLFKYDFTTHKETVILTWDTATWDASDPVNGLVLGPNGLIYGMSLNGGTYFDGILYSFDTTTYQGTILVNFYNTTGDQPWGNLIVGSNSLLYGVTIDGDFGGTLFSYNAATNNETGLVEHGPAFIGTPAEANGKLFCYTNASSIYGSLYTYNISTTALSDIINLSDHNGNINNGYNAGLIKASNGLIYGILQNGGNTKDSGVLFNLDPLNNAQNVLVNFSYKYGTYPTGALLQGVNDGVLYGITKYGGAYGKGTLFGYDPVKNTFKVCINFNGSNGEYTKLPSLVQDSTTGLIYGAASSGGLYNKGVLFWYNPLTGKDSVFFNFNDTDGWGPSALLLTGYSHPITLGEQQLPAPQPGAQVFPNPNNGKFTVVLKNISNNSEFEIYSLTGEKIYTCLMAQASAQIDISKQPSGLYFYRIISSTGNIICNGKLVIQ